MTRARRWLPQRREPKPVKIESPKRPKPAAGLLLTHTDETGALWVLLGLRSPRLGGTWSNIGGSLEHGELPLVAAFREFHEETRIPANRLLGGQLTAIVDDCGTETRPYTLYVLEVPEAFDDARLGWENDDLAWWSAADVDSLALHPGFARAWDSLRAGRAKVPQ